MLHALLLLLLATEALTPSQRDVFLASPEDPSPARLAGQAPELWDKHYVVSNEMYLDLYRDKLHGLGGGYIGVGSDQAYLFLGWQQPDMAWLIDYDDVVVQMHRVWLALIAAADSPEKLLALWQPEGRDAAEQALPDKGLRKLYRQNRARVALRLERVGKRMRKAGVPSYLTNAATYAAVRDRVLAGRVRTLRVDLLADAGLCGIGAAAKQLGVTVRALYLSNAENYWPYNKGFRRNVACLPFDDKSLVLRAVSTWQHNHDYLYNVQPAQNFLGWLVRPDVKSFRDFVRHKQPALGESWLFVTERAPGEGPVRH